MPKTTSSNGFTPVGPENQGVFYNGPEGSFEIENVGEFAAGPSLKEIDDQNRQAKRSGFLSRQDKIEIAKRLVKELEENLAKLEKKAKTNSNSSLRTRITTAKQEIAAWRIVAGSFPIQSFAYKYLTGTLFSSVNIVSGDGKKKITKTYEFPDYSYVEPDPRWRAPEFGTWAPVSNDKTDYRYNSIGKGGPTYPSNGTARPYISYEPYPVPEGSGYPGEDFTQEYITHKIYDFTNYSITDLTFPLGNGKAIFIVVRQVVQYVSRGKYYMRRRYDSTLPPPRTDAVEEIVWEGEAVVPPRSFRQYHSFIVGQKVAEEIPTPNEFKELFEQNFYDGNPGSSVLSVTENVNGPDEICGSAFWPLNNTGCQSVDYPEGPIPGVVKFPGAQNVTVYPFPYGGYLGYGLSNQLRALSSNSACSPFAYHALNKVYVPPEYINQFTGNLLSLTHGQVRSLGAVGDNIKKFYGIDTEEWASATDTILEISNASVPIFQYEYIGQPDENRSARFGDPEPYDGGTWEKEKKITKEGLKRSDVAEFPSQQSGWRYKFITNWGNPSFCNQQARDLGFGEYV